MTNMKILESSEDYLERILMLREEKKEVHSVDLAKMMSYSKPSVSRAVKKLKELSLITVDSSGAISLTEEGYRIANETYQKHKFFSRFLEDIGVNKPTAVADACRIEHALSEESFEAIKKYIRNSCQDIDDKSK